MKERSVQQIIQENLLNAQRASLDSAYPVSECTRAVHAWSVRLEAHYHWLGAYRDEDKKRRAAILLLAEGVDDPRELLARFRVRMAQSTVYDKLYDARNRPDYSIAEEAAECLSLQGEKRSSLLMLLGWYDASEAPAGVTRRELLDDARNHDHWMGACGSSLEAVGPCLMLARGTMEKLRKEHEFIDPRTAFRVLITLWGCQSAQKRWESSCHCLGIHLLEDGRMDRIAGICAQAYVQLLPLYRRQAEPVSRGNGLKEQSADRLCEETAHKVFWGTMYRYLKKNDYTFGQSFSSAFFAGQRMENLV